jgi:hypothetical protein
MGDETGYRRADIYVAARPTVVYEPSCPNVLVEVVAGRLTSGCMAVAKRRIKVTKPKLECCR